MISLDIETTGLDSATDTIVAIGCLDGARMDIISASVEEFKKSPQNAEKQIIDDFGSHLLTCNPDDVLLTYNGLSFDLPFIKHRAEKHGLWKKMAFLPETPHVDLFPFVHHAFGRRANKEEACSKLANLYVPRKNDGMWIARLYSHPELLTENDHLDMLAHNATDISSTYKLYNVLKEFPDFQQWQLEQSKISAKAEKGA